MFFACLARSVRNARRNLGRSRNFAHDLGSIRRFGLLRRLGLDRRFRAAKQPAVHVVGDGHQPLVADPFAVTSGRRLVGMAHDQIDGWEIPRLVGHRAATVPQRVEPAALAVEFRWWLGSVLLGLGLRGCVDRFQELSGLFSQRFSRSSAFTVSAPQSVLPSPPLMASSTIARICTSEAFRIRRMAAGSNMRTPFLIRSLRNTFLDGRLNVGPYRIGLSTIVRPSPVARGVRPARRASFCAIHLTNAFLPFGSPSTLPKYRNLPRTFLAHLPVPCGKRGKSLVGLRGLLDDDFLLDLGTSVTSELAFWCQGGVTDACRCRKIGLFNILVG